MTLEEAIKHCEEKERELKEEAHSYSDDERYSGAEEDCLKCAKEHEQLAEWLKELKALKERSQGDLISREALKKAFAEYGEKAKFTQASCQQLIDNAPTVETPCNDCCADTYRDGYEKGKADARPQGEWVTDDATYSTWRCNKCLHVQTICSNYCPNCGADMRGEEK